MFLWFGLIVFSGFAYYNRYRLLLLLFQFFVAAIQVYLIIQNVSKKWSNSRDDLRVIDIISVHDAKLHVVKMIINDKTRIMNVVQDMDVKTCVKTLESELRTKNELRNMIVSCSLQHQNDETLVELTDDVRKFVYHFDRNDEKSGLKYFLKYIENKYKLQMTDEWDLVFYINDDDFTERRITMDEAMLKSFLEVLAR